MTYAGLMLTGGACGALMMLPLEEGVSIPRTIAYVVLFTGIACLWRAVREVWTDDQ